MCPQKTPALILEQNIEKPGFHVRYYRRVFRRGLGFFICETKNIGKKIGAFIIWLPTFVENLYDLRKQHLQPRSFLDERQESSPKKKKINK